MNKATLMIWNQPENLEYRHFHCALANQITELLPENKQIPSKFEKGKCLSNIQEGWPKQKQKNYRPILLLNILSKVFERIIFKEVYNFLQKNNKLSHLQAAYTRRSSSALQLLEIYNTITENKDKGHAIRYVQKHLTLCGIRVSSTSLNWYKYKANYGSGSNPISWTDHRE